MNHAIEKFSEYLQQSSLSLSPFLHVRGKMMSLRDFTICLVRQRRMAWMLLLSILYTTVVWSWTSQRIISVPLAARASTSVKKSAAEKVSHYSRDPIIRMHRSIRLSNSAHFRPTSTASFSKSSLLFSDQEDQEIPSLEVNDSELINSLIRARTTREVEITLKKSLPTSPEDFMDFHSTSFDGVKQNTVYSDDNGSDTGGISFSRLSLNATAATLRRMAHISVFEARAELLNGNEYNIGSEALDGTPASRSQLQKKIIASLLEAIGIKLMSHRSSLSPSKSTSQEIHDPQERPGVYPLSDVLQALAVLAPDDYTKGKMKPFAILIVGFLNTHEKAELYKLGPIRLVQCLQAMAKLEIDHPSLYNKICQRLLKPDAVSKIPARFLSHGLSALAAFQTTKSQENASTSTTTEWDIGELGGDNKSNDESKNAIHKDTMRLSRAFMRRMRKQKVAEEASVDDMCRALVATRDLLDLGAMENMEDEAAMFGFTGLRTILETCKSSQDTNLLNPTQVTNMITSWASLSDQSREDTVIEDLLQICIDDVIIKGCSVAQLERIIRSIRKLNVANHAEVTRCVGERLLTLVEENESSNFDDFYPSTISEILRWPVLAHRRNKAVMEPFIMAASILFTRKSFLERTSVKEMANFLWFLSIARRFDEGILLNIGHCLMEDEMVDSCSPKIASRILATFTSLVVLKEQYKSEPLMELKQDLFYSYGGHLLSSNLSPAETSSALYAYAKANYVQDKGVFDHLVNLLASSRHDCSSRQLSQTLWSCGKMIAWEKQEMQLLDEESGEIQDPPYLKSALSIAKELSERGDELSPADVAQIFWGIGRLEIHDEDIMPAFANRTLEICSSMNSVEVSNILWGLAKIQYTDGKLIGCLTERLTEDSTSIKSPRVAASILFSLGRLRWKDEILFRKLSRTMITQIENVNAQSIANTMWAFRAVRMRPPRELLDTWAITRLGIVPVIEQPETD